MERIVKTNLEMVMTSAVGKTSHDFDSGIGESFQSTRRYWQAKRGAYSLYLTLVCADVHAYVPSYGRKHRTANLLNQYDAFTYDADGNMLSSGGLSYLWDAENRLKMATPVSPTNGTERVLSRYDHRNRRVLKRVEILTGAEYVPPPSPPGNPGEWVEVRSTAFVWDNDRIAAEVTSYTNGVVTTNAYFWGADVSGTVDGAAGVGGLLRASLNGSDVLYCVTGHFKTSHLWADQNQPLIV